MKEWIPIPGSNKEKILTTALEEFSSKGFAQTNITELAQKADVTTGAIYHHFGSKAQLYEIIKEEMEKRILDRMEGVTDLFEDPHEKLNAALKTGLDFVVKKEIGKLFIETENESRKNQIFPFLQSICTSMENKGVEIILYSSWIAIIKSITEETMTLSEGKNLIQWMLRENG
ncbi:TetR/AcrR family transcriptional regulator [Pseudalkalibacillus sp. SCS-8]|uniref:TetR/AcrR family transcriptional regulator n=1 Tax=Pseudalkalibacillus nanhaiensis TaxID=3115291 RepID=UPI0032DA830A